ncbi:hypothetical protein F511_20926 [Dorcoceras hygrometricum]|uniref:Splicing factor 3B subunit 1-like n=1 Tax=Dorcoceras hygrometricum TaxID=472368 RepID=A0A2Z7C9T6_9LAMI|nr:hypothetical protein F511_20926 [Dorcoceras hygrometricum]
MVPVVQEQTNLYLPAATPEAHRRRAPKRKLVLQKGSDDEIVDSIIHQVIADTAAIETGELDLEEPVVTETTAAVDMESRIYVSSITNYDEEEPLVETEGEEENDKEKEIELVPSEEMSLDKITDTEDTEPLSKIPDNMMLPSVTAEEPTKIKFRFGIEIPGVNDGDWYKASLPQIAITDKGKVPLVEKDEIKGHPAREMFPLICADIEFLYRVKYSSYRVINFRSEGIRFDSEDTVTDSVILVQKFEYYVGCNSAVLSACIVEIARSSLGARLSDWVSTVSVFIKFFKWNLPAKEEGET